MRPGFRHYRLALIGFALGAGVPAFLPALPGRDWLWLAVFLVPLAFWVPARARFVLAALLGLTWGLAQAHWQLAHRLPDSHAGEQLQLEGRIVGLPQRDSRRERVMLAVESVRDRAGEPLSLPLRRVRVSWYGGPPLRAGERWRFTLKVNPPRGFVNPGGFDYQLWLLRQGVDATGYVLPDGDHRRLSGPDRLFMGYWRSRVRQWLADQPLAHPELMRALLIGDRSGLSDRQWTRLQATGTNHLIAISGLHVGFVALLGFAIGSGLGRWLTPLWPRAGSVGGHLLAMALALGYAALAGFSIPTQRALVMVAVAQWALLSRRGLRPLDGLLLALAAVLGWDPLAPTDLGFWLSFAAVGVLLLAFVGRREGGRRWPGRGLWRAQWAVFVGLLLPLALLVGQVSLLAPLANLVAIPLVTLLVVPWLLLAAVLAGFWPWAAGILLAVADAGLGALQWWLAGLDRMRDWMLLEPHLAWPSVLLAGLGAGLCLMPRGWPGRAVGAGAVALALVLPGPPSPPLSVTFLDVGQGLAVVVRTYDHALVYDAGPRYSERLDAGSAIVAPYLRERGVGQLDRLVLSHRHEDHIGGWRGLARSLPVERVYRGEGTVAADGARDCHRARPWRWNGVAFRFLHAGWPDRPNANNRSCVLLIDYGGDRVLLTGDIEREVEWRLAGKERVPAGLTLLQVPHHGAAGSSTPLWVERTRPELAVVSAAHRSRFEHPAPVVVERYRGAGAELLNTARDGAITLRWRAPGDWRAQRARKAHRRWWH